MTIINNLEHVKSQTCHWKGKIHKYRKFNHFIGTYRFFLFLVPGANNFIMHEMRSMTKYGYYNICFPFVMTFILLLSLNMPQYDCIQV